MTSLALVSLRQYSPGVLFIYLPQTVVPTRHTCLMNFQPTLACSPTVCHSLISMFRQLVKNFLVGEQFDM